MSSKEENARNGLPTAKAVTARKRLPMCWISWRLPTIFTGTQARHTGRTWRTTASPCRSKSKNWNLTDRQVVGRLYVDFGSGTEERGQAVYAFACAVKRDHSFYAGHLAVLLMQKGRIENPSFCSVGCFSGSLHYSRLPENSFLKYSGLK